MKLFSRLSRIRRRGIGIELDKCCILEGKAVEGSYTVEIVKGSYFPLAFFLLVRIYAAISCMPITEESNSCKMHYKYPQLKKHTNQKSL